MKDLLGRDISIGDVVAISTRSRAQNYVRVGKVLELRPYEVRRDIRGVSEIEIHHEAFVEVFAGNGYRSLTTGIWDSYERRHIYVPTKSYRKAYRNERNIVIVEKHWLRIRELEEAMMKSKENEAKKRNGTAI